MQNSRRAEMEEHTLMDRLEYVPAHADRPFVRPHGDGVVFSAVLYGEDDLGIQLIHIEDGEAVYIPFTEEYRIGHVYSVRITPFDSGEYVYRYRSGGVWVHDPHAFEIRRVLLRMDDTGKKEEVAACSCAPLGADRLFEGAPEKPLPPADWAAQVIYGIHPKGFTAAKPEEFNGRGRFEGISAMIPYLQSLGVTAVELMPVYQLLPDLKNKKQYRTMEDALRAWPVGSQGDPLRDMKERPNYWGYGRGLYCALRPEYGTQEEFARMVHALHEAGLRIILRIYFEKGIPVPEQIRLLRFYVSRYGIDGFRLIGHIPSVSQIAASPALADTALLYHAFPFEEMARDEEASRLIFAEDMEDLFPPESAKESGADPLSTHRPVPVVHSRTQRPAPVRFPNLLLCSDDFQTLLRRFVKSDDYVMKDFLKLFLGVPDGHGEVRAVTGFEGFTLEDLVSYNERHNEANGEFGMDGPSDNYSWNCGEEGASEDPEILELRQKQIRNFLTLLLLSQGTPMLLQGDERKNSQGGNNNPYCQDNETSWVDWTDTPERRSLTAFTAKLTAFRRQHPIFRSRRPFQYIDHLGIGHPDVSLHGADAWKPDLSPFSHSIGICYCENYAQPPAAFAKQTVPFHTEGSRSPAFTYLAVNMYWKELSLALPKLPPDHCWEVFMDTGTEEGFLDTPLRPEDLRFVQVPARSIRILRCVYDPAYMLLLRKEEEERNLKEAQLSVSPDHPEMEETAPEECALPEDAAFTEEASETEAPSEGKEASETEVFSIENEASETEVFSIENEASETENRTEDPSAEKQGAVPLLPKTAVIEGKV